MIYLAVLSVTQSPEFHPKLVCVGFVKENVSLERTIFEVLSFRRVIFFPPILNTLSVNTILQS
jgi:hypothetical protein